MTSTRPIPRAVCTVASANYLAHVRTLAASLAAAHPDVPLFVLLCDRLGDRIDPAREPFRLSLAEALPNLPAVAPLFFKYDVLELNTAVKPFFFEWLLEQHGIERLVFLDPDIWITGSLDAAFAALDSASIALTPHLLAPIDDRARPSELDILRAGVFNLGFLALRAGDSARRLLSWWKARLYERGEMAPDRGVHVDQRWMDLAPSFNSDTAVLRDPTLNAGYWNLHERGAAIRERDGFWFVGDRPLSFFHFSGFDPREPEPISRHQDRYRLADFPALAPLFHRYGAALLANGVEIARHHEYAYRHFDNGVRIPAAARHTYRELGDAAARFGDPFRAAGAASFYAWLTEPVVSPGVHRAPALTRLHLAVWQRRPDLQRVFPRPWSEDHRAFTSWLSQRGPLECELDPAVLPAASAAAPDAATAYPGQRARRAMARTVLRLAAPLEPHLLERFGKHSPAIERARAWKRRLRSETSPADGGAGPAGAAPALPAASPPQLPFGVNLAGYVRGEFGVAEMARASAAALTAAGVPHVLVEARTHVHRHQDPRVTAVSDANPFGINLIHVNADQVGAFRELRGAGFFQDRRNIGVWFWEVEPFPPRWPDAFRVLDEIWVASRHVHSIVSRVSPIPVVHVPFPLHVAATPAPIDRARHRIPAETFAFLFHFDFLSELERKNPLGAVQAFQRAFGGTERVALVLKSINSEHAPEALARLRAAIGADPRVVHLDGHLTRDEMLSLIAGCDAYVSLHRAEGLGLGLAEALSFGKPVVATGYSGNVDFMTPSNSFLVGYELVTLDRDHGPYAAGSRWAEPDLGHAAELLRMVVRYPDLAAARGARAARELAAEWSAARAGRAMLERLRLVAPDLAFSEAP